MVVPEHLPYFMSAMKDINKKRCDNFTSFFTLKLCNLTITLLSI